MTQTCDICGGARFIRLPRRPQASVTAFRADAPIEPTANVTFLDIACPQCGKDDKLRIPAEKFTSVAYVEDVAEHYEHATGYLDHVKRAIANRLGAEMLRLGLIEFARGPSQPDSFGMSSKYELRGVIHVAHPDHYQKLEDRIAERQDEKAVEVVEEARRQIQHWGSEMGWRNLSKEDAARFVREALAIVRHRVKWRRVK